MGKRVIVESPFASTEHRDSGSNMSYAFAAMADSLKRGESPVAFHLLYPGALDDSDRYEREIGIGRSLIWYQGAALVAVYIDYGISPGMLRGILIADALDIRVSARRIATNHARTECQYLAPLSGHKCCLSTGHDGPHFATHETGVPLIW